MAATRIRGGHAGHLIVQEWDAVGREYEIALRTVNDPERRLLIIGQADAIETFLRAHIWGDVRDELHRRWRERE